MAPLCVCECAERWKAGGASIPPAQSSFSTITYLGSRRPEQGRISGRFSSSGAQIRFREPDAEPHSILQTAACHDYQPQLTGMQAVCFGLCFHISARLHLWPSKHGHVVVWRPKTAKMTLNMSLHQTDTRCRCLQHVLYHLFAFYSFYFPQNESFLYFPFMFYRMYSCVVRGSVRLAVDLLI